MRIMLFSDLHLDRPCEWAPPLLAKQRRDESRQALVQILAQARERKADLITCAGGLFARDHVSPATLRWLMTALESVAVPVFIAPGDDDWFGPRCGYTQYSWPGNVTVFNGDRLEPIEVSAGLTLWGAAHRSVDHTASFIERFQVDRGGVNLALLHGAERSGLEREPGRGSTATFSEEEVRRAGLDHVLAGHYYQQHSGAIHTYPGAPIAHDFESGHGGCVVLDVSETGAVEREAIQIASTAFTSVAVVLDGCKTEADVTKTVREAAESAKGFVRISLSGRLPYGLSIRSKDLLTGVPGVAGVVVETGDLSFQIDVDQLSQEPSVRGEFVREVMSSRELSDRQRSRVLMIGLRSLEGQDSFEVLA